MALLHFPTNTPLTGRSKKIFRGRRVRCISPKRSHVKPDLPYAERRDIAFKALVDLQWQVFTLGDSLLNLKSSTACYLSTEAPRSDIKQDNGEWRRNPSIREVEVLRGAALRFAQALKPIEIALGIQCEHAVTDAAQQA